jgi:hypothetical protein
MGRSWTRRLLPALITALLLGVRGGLQTRLFAPPTFQTQTRRPLNRLAPPSQPPRLCRSSDC